MLNMRNKNVNNNELTEIQQRLRESIEKSGLEQKFIAKKIGVSAQTVSKYITCDVFPSLDTFARLCKVVDVSSDYILGLKEF